VEIKQKPNCSGRCEPSNRRTQCRGYVLSGAQAEAFLPAPVARFQTDLFLPKLTAPAIATITAATNDAPPNARVFVVPLYGAISRVGLNDMAFPLRQSGYELDIVDSGSLQQRRRLRCNGSSLCETKLQPFAH
jgi:hypothetical protein